MARTWTQRTILTGSIAKVDDPNFEMNGVLGEFNGGLDQHNMPLKSVVTASLSASAIVNDGQTIGSVGVFNAHYFAGPYATPGVYSIDNGNIGVGWNAFPATCSLSFTAREGMLKGAAIVTAEKLPAEDDTTNILQDNSNYWWEVAVFVNDTMVAKSGHIHGKKYTLDLPFGCPIGNEAVVVEARWQAPAVPAWALNKTSSLLSTPFVHSASFTWVRNIYR